MRFVEIAFRRGALTSERLEEEASIMIMTETWSALGRSLDGLLATYEIFCRLPSNAVNGSQEKALLKSATALAINYINFRTNLASLPGISLPMFDEARMNSLAKNSLEISAKILRSGNLAELLIRLGLLRNDINIIMSDGQEEIRSRAERAFLHLQWSIAANEVIRTAWISAFNLDETACEALGATHLLSHGIFAFKANSSAARTDLVFHEPIDQLSAAVAEGLVLTEWKRLKQINKLNNVVDSAGLQTALYASGVLGGRELRRVRYIVIVSSEQVSMPADLHRDDYVIRHINIAVQPKSPSVAAPILAKALKQDVL